MWHCADLCMRSQDMKLNSHQDRFSLPPSYVTPHVFTCSAMGARSSCQEASYKPRNVCTAGEGHISNSLILSYVHSIFQSWKKKSNRWIEQTMTFLHALKLLQLWEQSFRACTTKADDAGFALLTESISPWRWYTVNHNGFASHSMPF